MVKFLSVLFFTLVSFQLSAAEYTVKLVTSGTNGAMMVMEPGFIHIEKGDVVNFIPSDSSHNAESFFIPEGAEAFNTPFGKPTKITFNNEGIYLYKCMPHMVMGMLGVVQVGKAVNKEQANKAWQDVQPTVAMNKDRMEGYLKQVK
jgi:pseudoazurin